MIPGVLKSGVIVPVYKAGGKDPLCIDSYRGSYHPHFHGFYYLIGLSQSLWIQVCHKSISQHTEGESHVQIQSLPHRGSFPGI